MYKISCLLTVSLLSFINFTAAQSTKHLWQLPIEQPCIAFNQKGQMSVFTYDRLSIYNIETGTLEKSYDFLANRSPYIWPTTAKGDFSEDFTFYRFYGQNKDLSGNRGIYARLDVEKQEWQTIPNDVYKYPYENHRSIDINGRDIVDNNKKEVFLYKPNGKKIKKIVSGTYVNVMVGGRFGVYNDNGQHKIIDFRTDAVKDLEFSGKIQLLHAFPEWILIENGANLTLFNPFTNEREVKKKDEELANVPSKYIACRRNFKEVSNFGIPNDTFYGNYRYQIQRDSLNSLEPDEYGAIPRVIKQYSISTCELVRTFSISASKSENNFHAAKVAPIYEGLNLMDAKYKKENKARDDWNAQSLKDAAERKDAENLAKELLVNFKDGGDVAGFSLLGLKGRDITNLPYTKRYLSHIKGEVTAIFQFICGNARILVVGAKVGNDLTFIFIKTSYTGVYKFTKNIANVYNRGNLITENIAIGFRAIGGSIKADATFMYPATGKNRTTVVYAPCSGDWK